MKVTNHNSTLLNSNNEEAGFIVGKYDDPLMYAAIPVSGSTTKLAIIHQGNILKMCRNRQSALNFIDKHRNKKRK
jgi:predicted RNA-binding Zn ribbon-like protein